MRSAEAWVLLLTGLAGLAVAAEPMPAALQNSLVQKYCAVCHMDTARNGGLTLEHFDSAQASPSLTAMMLSKLSGGVPLEIVRRMDKQESAALLVEKKIKSGAMGASGIPRPDSATVSAFVRALAAESAGATGWAVGSGGRAASILREVPSANGEEARAYRLLISCGPEGQKGVVQLAWSPEAQIGSLTAAADGAAGVRYAVGGPPALAAIELSEGRNDYALPKQSLRVKDLFPGETVVFPFADLPHSARQGLEACFSSAQTAP